MKMNRTTAEELIEEISSILNHDINIMDETGTIIASTNKSRSGQFHEGAHRLITGKLNELLVFYDGEYYGCKKGINLPIIMNDDIIGVVGITGDVNEIYPYAQIIKKVTEILMKDLARIQCHSRKERRKLIFLTAWLNGNAVNSTDIEKELKKHNIKPDRSILIALIRSADSSASVSAFFDSRIDDSVLLTCYGNGIGIIMGNFDSCDSFRDYIISCFNHDFPQDSFIITTGACCPDYTDAPISYRQAHKIMVLKSNSPAGIYLYDDLLLELIIDQVDKTYKKQFTEKIFGRCKHEDIPDIINFINIYYDCNGSISAIANRMFIHKNTVQYKINKIITMTGLDLRISRDLTSLYLASQWYEPADPSNV